MSECDMLRGFSNMDFISKEFKKVAFTLAEVIITLGIIGVVAAMTVPALINNVRDIQFRSQLLKSYALIQQTLKKMEADDIPLLGERGKPFYKDFKNYHSNIIDCGIGFSATNLNSNCNTRTLKTDDYKNLTGTHSITMILLDDGQLSMPDGTLLFFENSYSSNNPPVWIWVDVNGRKLPNQLGHDLFCFQLTDDGLKPMGAPGTRYDEETYCNKKGGGSLNGIGCANKIVKDPKYYKWLKSYD